MVSPSYTFTAKAFHWVMAAVIAVILVIGIIMVELPKGDVRTEFHALHKQIGVFVLLLAVLRLGYRLKTGVPALPSTMPDWEQRLAHWGHLGLYGLMVLIPIMGIAMSQAGNHPVSFFNFVLPTLIDPDKDLREIFEDGHALLAYTMVIILVGHAGAALRHHFVLKDDVLTRMLPWKNLKRSDSAPL